MWAVDYFIPFFLFYKEYKHSFKSYHNIWSSNFPSSHFKQDVLSISRTFLIAHHYYMYYRSIVKIHNVIYAIHQMKSSIVSSVWLSIFTCIFVITPVLLLHTKLVLIKRTFQKMLRTRGNQFYYDILHDGECRAISFHQTHASSLIGRWLRVQYRSDPT